MLTAGIKYLGDYINSQFVPVAKGHGELKNYSPADLQDHIMNVPFNHDHMDEACLTAKKAYQKWGRLTSDERKIYLLKLKEVLTAHSAEMAEIISRDTGKPMWEAKTEAAALISKIDITLNFSTQLIAEERIANALPQVDGVIRHRSRGVMAVVGPFNFPAHLPNGHIIPALIAGNTIVYKPSEQTPAVGQFYAQMFDKAQFTERFYQAAKKITIGHWSEDPFMGPLINAQAVEKYIRFQEIANRENCESLMRGKALESKTKGHFVTPSIHLVNKFDQNSVYQKSEIFGPNVAIYQESDFEQMMNIVNSTGYGLVMALFTKDKSLYDNALFSARVGLLNWNRTTNGASSRLPFGGMGKSGNDRASAHYAIQYCTVPVASLEDPTGFDATKVLPGLNY